MNSRERLIAALNRQCPDRLPATTHHLMPSFLSSVGGISEQEFFDRFGLDAIRWVAGPRPATGAHDEDWLVEREDIADPTCRTTRFHIVTPRGSLSMLLQDDGRTEWVRDRLIKKKGDLNLIEGLCPSLCAMSPM